MVCNLGLMVGRPILKFGVMKIRIVEDPSPEAWNRVRGYASRMRQVRVNDQPNVVVDTFHRFCLSSPPGGWFPALQDLYWGITESNLPFANLFFSPHLEKISIYTSWPLSIPEDPQKFSAAIASMISALPTSALQLPPHLPGPTVRCSDKPFNSASPPPYLARRMPSASPRITFTPVFPPLVSFVLGDGAHGWFSLFGRMEDGTHVILQYTIYNKIRRRLESSLEFRGWEEVGRESLLSSLGGGDSRYGGLVALPYTTDSSWFGRAPTHATA